MTEILSYRSFVFKLLSSVRFRLSEERHRTISDKELASFIGITPSEFSRVISGVVSLSSIAFFRLLAKAKFLNLSIDDRLDGQLSLFSD